MNPQSAERAPPVGVAAPLHIHMDMAGKLNAAERGQEENGLVGRGGTYKYSEPKTHLQNKRFWESLCGPCMPNRTQITNEELRHFYALKDRANVSFDPASEDHTEILWRLWSIIFGEKSDSIPNEKWKEIGFQGSDPRTDFRGGGMLSLTNLINFAGNHREMVLWMSEPQNDFFWAATSINVTFFLVRYFHLANSLVLPRDRAEIAPRRAFKTFCALQVKEFEFFESVHAMLCEDVFKIWMQIKAKSPKTTIMDFPKAMDALKKKLRRIFESRRYLSFDELKGAYSRIA